LSLLRKREGDIANKVNLDQREKKENENKIFKIGLKLTESSTKAIRRPTNGFAINRH
jgi:hypothetical protein